MRNFLKLFTIMIFGALIVIACSKESNDETLPEAQEREIQNMNNDVWICHKPDGQNPHGIWVDASAVAAHLAHGDELLDADGDGFTAPNSCGEGTMDDCDDTDATVNPGAEEACDDEIDNDCDGDVDEDCLFEFDFYCPNTQLIIENSTNIRFYNNTYSDCGGSTNYTETYLLGDNGVFNGISFDIYLYDLRNYGDCNNVCGGPLPDYLYLLETSVGGVYCHNWDVFCDNGLTEAEYNGIKQWLEDIYNGALSEGRGVESRTQLPNRPEGLDFEMLRPKLGQN